MTAAFTIGDLTQIMRECAGVADSVDLDADIGDVTFDELGYDSLAVLEMATQINNRYGVKIPDDAVLEMRTPRAAVDYVNMRGGLG